MATLTFEEATSVKCFSCRDEAPNRVFLADDDRWGTSIEELLSDVFPAEITDRCREVAIGYEHYGVGLCDICVNKLEQTSQFLSRFCESLLGFEVPVKVPSAKRKRQVNSDAAIKKKMKTNDTPEACETVEAKVRPGLKEIMRIIIDSASDSKLIQSEVTIAEDRGEDSYDDTIDLASMLAKEATAGESLSDNSGSEEAETDEAEEESDVSCDLEDVACTSTAVQERWETTGDHSYFVRTAAHEETKQAAIHRQVMRTRRYVRKRKRALLNSLGKESAESGALESVEALLEDRDVVVSDVSQSESTQNETETGEVPVAEVDWATIKRVMDNVVFVSNSDDGVPKEIHVRIENEENKKLTEITEVKTEIPESVQSIDGALLEDAVTSQGLGRLPKMLTCAYCERHFEDTAAILAHYDLDHDESVDDLIARATAKMGARVRERMLRYNTLGAGAVEVKPGSGGKASGDGGEQNYQVCRICYFKFRKSEYEAHILLQHYWARIKALRKQQEDSDQVEYRHKRKPRVPVCCEECGSVFNIYEAFCAHMWEVHNIEEYRREGIPQVKHYPRTVLCEACGKYFKNKHSLQCHVSEFHNKTLVRPRRSQPRSASPLRCDLCTYTTPEARRLKAHISRVHLGINSYKCPFCTYTTSEQTALRHHKYTHTTNKPIGCKYCNFRCVQKHDIRSHLKRSHGIVIDAVRSLRHYSDDLDLARRERKAAIEEQKKHFTETKDEQLHSCRGNEYYGEPYGDDNPYPRPRVRTQKANVKADFVESTNGVEYFFTEDGVRIELEADYRAQNDTSGAESTQAARILEVNAEEETNVYPGPPQIKSEQASNFFEGAYIENEQVFLKPQIRVQSGSDPDPTKYVMEVGEDAAGNKKFAIVARPVAGGVMEQQSQVADNVAASGQGVGADGGDADATFMIEVGTDESGSARYAVITNEQLGALTRSMDVKAEALEDVVAVPHSGRLADATSGIVEVTSQFADIVTSSQGEGQVWNSPQGFSLNYEAGIPSDYSA